MSIVRTYDVFCDGKDDDGCPDAAWATDRGSTLSAKEARLQARHEGWRRRKIGGRMVDLCPRCASTRECRKGCGACVLARYGTWYCPSCGADWEPDKGGER